jgi:hypothetical protein
MVKQVLPKAGKAILDLFNKLGGNMNNVLGSRSNITFLGKGKTPEGFIDSDINIEAIGVLGKNKILEELESSIGYLTAGKLNDVQANKLLSNMTKIDDVFNPKQIPNITDLGTGTRDLTQEGLGSLRAGNRQMDDIELADFEAQMGDRLEAYDFDGTIKDAQRILADDKAYTDEMFAQYKAGKLDPQPGEVNREKFLRGKFEEMEASGDKRLMTRDEIEELSAFDDLPPSGSRGGPDESPAFPSYLTRENIDLPPPGSRGGPDDIAAGGIMNVEDVMTMQNKGGMDFIDFVRAQGDEAGAAKLQKEVDRLNAASEAADARAAIINMPDAPVKRGVAREFLVEALKKDETDFGTAAFGKTNLNNIISAEDVKYITEGGGGAIGDPLVLVEKYFGPRILEALPPGASSEEILIFTNRVLNNVEDAAGLKPDNPRFDRFTARFVDEVQDFAKGGLAKILEV